ncbi:hypothetical protein WMY93_015071 [Mugilogobius chulae]|uniref:Gypsy retrotransposon integrase-like protein 1 n=1 Tax=Mugilogobius chulae TaxID=88201 RepID=A0AAW0P3E1_9GOBI
MPQVIAGGCFVYILLQAPVPAGKQNIDADALSRRPHLRSSDETPNDAELIHQFISQHTVDSDAISEEIVDAICQCHLVRASSPETSPRSISPSSSPCPSTPTPCLTVTALKTCTSCLSSRLSTSEKNSTLIPVFESSSTNFRRERRSRRPREPSSQNFLSCSESEVQRYVVEHIVKSDDMRSSHRLRTFSGRVPRPQHEVDFDTWRAGVDLILRDAAISEFQRSRYILDSLLPPAADVVKHLSSDLPAEIYIQHLESAYGTVQDGEELYVKFMDTLQDSERLQQAPAKSFCRGCWDNTLISELQLKQRKSNPPPFSELLTLLRTEEDREANKAQRMKQHLGTSKQRVTAQAQYAVEEDGVCAALSSLTKQVAEIQRQLAALLPPSPLRLISRLLLSQSCILDQRLPVRNPVSASAVEKTDTSSHNVRTVQTQHCAHGYRAVLKTLQLSHQQKEEGNIGVVRLLSKAPVRVPAGRTIVIEGSAKVSSPPSSQNVLLQHPASALPGGLCVSSCLISLPALPPYKVPVIISNESEQDTFIPPYSVIADLEAYHCVLSEHRVTHPTAERPSSSVNIDLRARPIHPQDIEAVRRHLRELLEAGVIRESSSPFSSPVVVVRKKNGEVRLCIDYRKLNLQTVKDAYALPNLEESFSALSGSKWFSVLDLKSGYYQIEMSEEDKPKTAFVTPLGFWEFNRMPQGVTNAPSTFQRLMERCMGDLHLKEVLVFLDDLIIFSDSLEEHERRLLRVLDRLHHWESKEINTPQDTHLQSKSAIWRTVESQLSACFESLITKLTTAPVLGFADSSQPYILHTDASVTGLGAALYQEQKGKLRVIAYASRGLSQSESHYPAHKLEFLALKWAVTEKFQDYLYGAEFTVVTDSNPLTYILTTAKLDATGHRWLAALSTYSFKLLYRAGKQNIDADALSRRPHLRSSDETPNDAELIHQFISQHTVDSDAISEEIVDAICQCHLVRASSPEDLAQIHLTLIESLSINADTVPDSYSSEDLHQLPLIQTLDIREKQHSDPCLRELIHQLQTGEKIPPTARAELPELPLLLREWSKLELVDGILYRRRRDNEELSYQLVLPEDLRPLVLQSLHDNMGHMGIDRTLDLKHGGKIEEQLPEILTSAGAGHVGRVVRLILKGIGQVPVFNLNRWRAKNFGLEPNRTSAQMPLLTCQSVTRRVHDRNIQLVDPPGFFDTDPESTDTNSELLKGLTQCAPRPHAFVLVLKVERYTQQEKNVVQTIVEYYSDKIFKYTTVVFTHGGCLQEGLKIEDWVCENEALSSLVQKCGGRCHVFDNRYWNNSQDTYRNNQHQVTELLKTIEQTVEKNEGGYYTSKLLQDLTEENTEESTESTSFFTKIRSIFK